jgi:hypothetical protein
MDGKSVLGGLVLGMVLTLLLDPSRGGRRRAIARDRVARYTRRACQGMDDAVTDLTNRARGVASTTRARFHADEVDDERLLDQVRSKVWRVCSHPRAIEVEVHEGEVSLSGPILADEVKDVLTATASVCGVHAVVNALEPHDSAEGVPSLQGNWGRTAPALDLLHEHWSPATTGAIVGLAALAAGGVAIAARARR